MEEQRIQSSAMDLDSFASDISAIQVESVMAKLPLHTLSTQGQMQVSIEKRDEGGDVSLLWQVSPSRQYGEPRQLAYRLDTLVINRRLDEAGTPTPKILRLGSMRSICRELGLSESGHNFTDIKQSLSQNAGATITARIFYRDRDGKQRKLEAIFSRYSVVFTGDTLPDGSEADGVFIIMNDVFQSFLNQVPRRPLDFNYLKQLTPSACRFYEIVSFRLYTALKCGWPRVSVVYSEYCEATGQRRLFTGTEVSKQMYKVHKPHLDSGYLAKVELEKIVDVNGQPDWHLWYAPGSRAKDEYNRFNASREAVATSNGLLPQSETPAETLVAYFLTERFGRLTRRAMPKELAVAKELLRNHSPADAQQRISAALRLAQTAQRKPRWLSELQVDLAALETNHQAVEYQKGN